jgi:type II secretion system protein G
MRCIPCRARPTNRGFTLIELLVVVAIIGMLASVVIASLGNVRVKGRDARRIADLTQIRTALELYYSTNNEYPTNGYWTCSFDAATWNGLQTALAPYIKVLPKDPLNTGYPWVTGSYGYCYGRISANEYDLVTQLEDPNNRNRCALNGWLARFADPDASWCGALGFSQYIYTDH